MAYNNTNIPAGQLNENQGITATGLNQPGAAPISGHNEHKHQGRDTALAAGAAGFAGHKFREHGHKDHHYGRDGAAAAALGCHELHKHQDNIGGIDSKPSAGDKIKGSVEKVIGKVTGNDAKVLEGEETKRGRTL